MRICTVCRRAKSPEDFAIKPKGGPDNRKSQCKVCSAAKQRQYYTDNRKKVMTTNEKWRKANPEKYAAIQKRSRAKRQKANRAKSQES